MLMITIIILLLLFNDVEIIRLIDNGIKQCFHIYYSLIIICLYDGAQVDHLSYALCKCIFFLHKLVAFIRLNI